MASVLDQILAWSRTRPAWQQDALRRLLSGAVVDDTVIALYADCCLGGKPEGLQALDENHLGARTHDPEAVIVTAMRDADSVNSLAAGQELTFAPTGMTVVYGDNGAGKSGYARILKAITRTRAQEQVHSDIVQAAGVVPSATVDYRVGGQSSTHAWVSGTPAPEVLANISFFDRACSTVYLSRETDVAFRPFGLGLFDELVGVCERVRAALDKRASDSARRTPGLPVLDDTTAAGRFLQRLTAQTGQAELDAATIFAGDDETRLHMLAEAADRSNRGTAASDAARLLRLVERADRLKTVIGRIEALVSEAAWEELRGLWSEARSKAEARQAARTQTLSGTILPGIGDATWRSLWEAARAYSQQEAYPGKAFPVTDGVCVLCQQPLDGSSASRLCGFEAFIRDHAEQAAIVAERHYQDALRKLEEMVVADRATSDSIDDLRAEDQGGAAVLEHYSTRAADAQSALVQTFRSGSPTVPPSFPALPTARLEESIARLRLRAEEFQRATIVEGAQAAAVELAELRARKSLANSKVSVLAEHTRLQLQASIVAAKSAASTNSITQKGAELTNTALTEVLMDRFSRETDLARA